MSAQDRIVPPIGYRLEGVVGRSGFGITDRVRDLDLNQAVAIKEYPPRAMALRARGETVDPLNGTEQTVKP